jgi:uncharacterized membrane protein YfcA
MHRRIIGVLAAIGVHERLSADQRHDIAVATAQTTPGAVASVLSKSAGWTMGDLVSLLTAIFLLLQVGYLIWKWRRDDRRERERQEDRRNGRRPDPVCETGRSEL